MGTQKLISSFQDTVQRYRSQELRSDTERAAASSKVYTEGFVSEKQRGGCSAGIIVEENTTFAAAKKYLFPGRTAVLNFANAKVPGGGVRIGAMAQEECLCRSSNLYACLTAPQVQTDYYIYNKSIHSNFYSDRLIYTKDVTVFKDDEEIPVLMPTEQWFKVDVITCAAPNLSSAFHIDKTKLKDILTGRIRNIFEAAIENDVKVLILGAFGCGAFRNPPEIVASVFKDVIDDNGYAQQFEKIVFAIKKTGKKENYDAFRSVFPPDVRDAPIKCIRQEPLVVLFDPDVTVSVVKRTGSYDAVGLYNVIDRKFTAIDKTEFTIGRRSDSDLVLKDRGTSRSHAKISFDGASWFLQDQNSTNGTWLNNTKLTGNDKYILRNEDVIDLGHKEMYIFKMTPTNSFLELKSNGAACHPSEKAPKDNADTFDPTIVSIYRELSKNFGIRYSTEACLLRSIFFFIWQMRYLTHREKIPSDCVCRSIYNAGFAAGADLT